jgi:hypothetical protein
MPWSVIAPCIRAPHAAHLMDGIAMVSIRQQRSRLALALALALSAASTAAGRARANHRPPLRARRQRRMPCMQCTYVLCCAMPCTAQRVKTSLPQQNSSMGSAHGFALSGWCGTVY